MSANPVSNVIRMRCSCWQTDATSGSGLPPSDCSSTVVASSALTQSLCDFDGHVLVDLEFHPDPLRRYRHDLFARKICSVSNGCLYCLRLQGWIALHDLIGGVTGCQIVKHNGYHNPCTLDAGLSMTHRWIDRDIVSPIHIVAFRSIPGPCLDAWGRLTCVPRAPIRLDSTPERVPGQILPTCRWSALADPSARGRGAAVC